MRKNYLNLPVDLLDRFAVSKTSFHGMFKKVLLFLMVYLCPLAKISAQCNTDAPLPFINSSYGNLTASGDIDGVCVLCSALNASRLIDTDLNNFATANVVLGAAGSVSFKVTDGDADYPAGTYAGYRIDTNGLLTVNLLGSITIRTYLDGVLKESSTGASLLGAGLLNGSGNDYVVGFNTTQNFDAIEISVGSLVSLLNSVNVYYPVIRNYCAGPALSCNTVTAMNLPVYPVSIEPSHTGVSGIAVGNVYDAANVISTSTSDYARIALTAGLAASGSIAVKDQLTDYPAGTYAGFEIENSSLLNVSALGNVGVTTYLNGVQQEQFFGNNLVVNGALLNNAGRYKVGFVSTASFDELRLTVNQTLALNLGTTRVYSAVFENFCAGPDLVCNTQTAMLAPTYPVYINGENTGIDGLVCALCSVNNTENLIDQNASNFAQINLGVSVGNSGSISVKNQITDYPIGTFAGFTIEKPSLLNVNVLDAITIRTYLNGVLQETKFGETGLASVGTGLLVGSSLQTIGFVTTKAFDEARITFANTASITLSIVNVYHAVFQKLCSVTLECNKTYAWTNPDFPVTIDSGKTGVDGVACVACAVNNTNNVLTASATDFASILVTAGVISPASIAVVDNLSTYPAGTYAGFTISDRNSLLQLDLFNSLTISTYLDGVLRESRSASQLLNLLLLTPYGTGKYNVGFQTAQSFDEIRISVGSLASVINDINVYGAFVNTAGVSGGTLFCAVIDAVDDTTFPSAIGASGNANIGNVLSNDTINGAPVTINDVNVSVVTPAVPVSAGAPVPSIDPVTGIVSIPAGTPAGNYTITYQICYKLNALTCDTAEVKIAVTAAVIDAVADDNSTNPMVYGSTGGNTGINVYANDTLNGNPVNPSDVILTSAPNGPLTVHADGSVTVAPNTPGGTYTVNYTICEKLNPSNCDTAAVSVFVSAPSIAVVKVGAVGGTGTAGDVITYTFTVTNTGNTPLTNVVINDVLLGSVNLAVTPSTLAPNAVGTATALYTIQQTDVDAGKVTNTATVTGTTPDGGTVDDISGTTITNDDQTVTTLTPDPHIALVKVGAVGGTGTVGDVITYTFTVTNTGNTTLSNVVVNDGLTGSVNLAVTPSTLLPNAVGTATAAYTIQQPDVDAGQVTNTATVTGTPPAGPNVSDTSGTTITNDDPTVTTLIPSPKIAVVKTAVVGGKGEAGYPVTYTFTVTNTGNTTLSGVVVNDPLIQGSAIAVVPGTLAPNAIGTATAAYTILQSDMDAGQITNSAVASGNPPSGPPVTDVSGNTTAVGDDIPTVTPLNRISSIALIKTGTAGGTGAVGDVITYTFTIINTGNTTITNMNINDPLLSSTSIAVTPPNPSGLAPNASMTVTSDYIIKQSDIDLGKVINSAEVTGITTIGSVSNTASTETLLNQNSSVALVKEAVIGGAGAVGEKITYTFTVTNTGNTTLKDIFINDALTASVNLPVTLPDPLGLAPNTSAVVTVDYIIKQSDMDAGKVTNSAVVTATAPDGPVSDTSGTAITNDDATITTLSPVSKIVLVKQGTVGGSGAAGETITYTFTVSNMGNTTLSNILVNDPLTASVNLLVIPSTLTPGTSGTVQAVYTIKQSDIDFGKVTNTAVVTAIVPTGGTVTDISGITINDDTPTETALTQNPKIALVKTGAVIGAAVVGNKITYTFTVSNTGNTTLNTIVVNDLPIGITNLSVIPVLAPNTTASVTADYIIKQSDIDAGNVTNSAVVTGTIPPPVGGTVSDVSGTAITNDTPTVTTLTQNPGISITADGVYVDLNNNGTANVGDVVTYTLTVTNTGNLALSGITITPDSGTTVNGNLNSLAVGASNSASFTASHVLTSADIEAGYVYGSFTVSANSSANTSVTAVSTDPTPCTSCPAKPGCVSCTITAVPQSPSIGLVKEGSFKDSNGDGLAQAGETITYTFTVTNTGNLALTNVVLTDALPGVVITGGPINLAVGEINTTSFSGVYVLTQQDVINGSVSNQAKITATNGANIPVMDMSDDNSVFENDSTVLSVNGCVIEVFNALSPGSDGYHDFFLIQGIECYPKNSVEIYNRWGIKVYDAEGYNNNTIAFRGISEGRGTVSQSEGLPTGTYFYVIKYQDFNGNGIDKSGYLDLNRD